MLLSALPADKKNKNDIVKYLHETKYDGVTGPVYFNVGGERVVSPVYFYIIRGREFLQRDLRGPEFLEYGKMR
jgi:ABC-type branched-subunit amino acid transport system substrate-binding protein